MTPLKSIKRFFLRLCGLRDIEQRVEHIAREQDALKGDVRQMQQKTDSLRHLVKTMRRKEDWVDE